MFSKYNEQVQDSTPGRFEGESAMVAYLYERSLDGDGELFTTESGDWCVLFGKRVLTGSSIGFVSLVRFDSSNQAGLFAEKNYSEMGE